MSNPILLSATENQDDLGGCRQKTTATCDNTWVWIETVVTGEDYDEPAKDMVGVNPAFILRLAEILKANPNLIGAPYPLKVRRKYHA